MDMQEINARVIEQFRSGADIDGMHRDRLLLLTTTGAKTGQRRTTPVMFQADGERLLVIASNAGAPRNPDWYRNLVVSPTVTVEVGGEQFDAIAAPTVGADRERVWAMLKENYPFFADHEALAGREIPVVALSRLR